MNSVLPPFFKREQVLCLSVYLPVRRSLSKRKKKMGWGGGGWGGGAIKVVFFVVAFLEKVFTNLRC